MASIIPIAFNNSGTPIPGTSQVGDLSIGDTAQDYGAFPSGYRFWATPDLDNHYVIAYPVPAGNHPNPLSIPCYVGFFQTPTKSDVEFINLAEYISVQDNDPQNFLNTTEAQNWLTANGYWNSYPASKRILFLGDGSVNDVASNISTYISATGQSITYSAVTMGTTYTGGGGITTAEYDAVFIYTNGGQTGGAGIGTALQNYINSGGNVISGVFLWNVYASGFQHSAVTAFNVTNVQSNSVGSLNVVTPSPITNGIGTSLPSSFSNGSPTLSAGAQQYATFTDGVNCLAVKTVGSSTLVSINAFPANINNSTSTLCKMFGNAILYATGAI